MRTVAVIQARMRSSRLPGKVMLPLGDECVLYHVLSRTRAAEEVDDVVIATSELPVDDVITRYARRESVAVHRGPHEDVLQRIYNAADNKNADVIVRVSADSPLVLPEYIDHAASRVKTDDPDYVTVSIDRTIPLGLGCESFTMDSFKDVAENATTDAQREHVTKYYRDNRSAFDIENVSAADIESLSGLIDGGEFRLVIDTPDDYELLFRIFDEVPYEQSPDIKDVIDWIRELGLQHMNR